MQYLDRKTLDQVLDDQISRLIDHCQSAPSIPAEKMLLDVIRYVERDRPGGVSVDPVLKIVLETVEPSQDTEV